VTQIPPVGTEWVVDARGCDPHKLRDRAVLEQFVARVLREVSLNAVLPPLIHVVPGEGGITAMVLLAESHLTFHTFPEHGTLTANLYCCSERPPWPWPERVTEVFGATRVDVRTLPRGGY
jgi:S-adenosylmethionine decarboxylase